MRVAKLQESDLVLHAIAGGKEAIHKMLWCEAPLYLLYPQDLVGRA
jgi:hypothetical protein